MPIDLDYSLESMNSLIKEVQKIGGSLKYTQFDHSVFSVTEATAMRDSLIELVTVTTALRYGQSTTLIPAVDTYIRHPNQDNWRSVVFTAHQISEQISHTKDIFLRTNIRVVFEAFYAQFLDVFESRLSILNYIESKSAVGELPDVKSIKRLRNSYVKLIRSLKILIQELSKYARGATNKETPQNIMHITASEISAAKTPILVISVLGAVAGVMFGAFGIWLVIAGDATSETVIRLFGQQIKTENVGVACIFIGAVTVMITLRRVLKTVDVAIKKKTV